MMDCQTGARRVTRPSLQAAYMRWLPVPNSG